MKNFVACVVCAVSLAAPSAAVVKIDFEDLPAMTFWSGNAVPANAKLRDQYLRKYGVRFNSGGGYAVVTEHGEGHAVSGIKAFGGSTAAGTLTYSPDYPIEISFHDREDPEFPAVTDFVSVRMDLRADSGEKATLQGYSLDGRLIVSTTLPDTPGGILTVTTKTPEIHTVRFFGYEHRGIGLDDLEFNVPTMPSGTPPPGDVRVLIDGKVAGFGELKPLLEKGQLIIPFGAMSPNPWQKMISSEGVLNTLHAMTGDDTRMLTPVRTIRGIAYFRLRDITDQLGAKVKWHAKQRTVSITSDSEKP